MDDLTFSARRNSAATTSGRATEPADLETRFRNLVQSPLRAGLLRYLSAHDRLDRLVAVGEPRQDRVAALDAVVYPIISLFFMSWTNRFRVLGVEFLDDAPDS